MIAESGAGQIAPENPPLSSAASASRGPSQMEMRPAVFFDRDGTLMKDVSFVSRPEDVELVADAAQAVRRLNIALWPVIVATNQSGIARGLLTEQDYCRVRDRLDELLAERGAYIAQHYHCPHHPDFTGPCFCRKPATALFDRAMSEHALNPALSVWVGDRWRDIAPALHYGAVGMLVPSPTTPADDIERATRELVVVPTLTDAVHRILPV